MTRIAIPEWFDIPKGYTRIVKPYGNGKIRKGLIEWCERNCQKQFMSVLGHHVTDEDIIAKGENVHILYFECKKDATMFTLAN